MPMVLYERREHSYCVIPVRKCFGRAVNSNSMEETHQSSPTLACRGLKALMVDQRIAFERLQERICSVE